jgi:pSer/pThr/pTyr-binding forkhead associated (FHA) protein
VVSACSDGEDALISDLRSTNGTNVNGMDLEPLQPYQLPLGSVIIFGA